MPIIIILINISIRRKLVPNNYEHACFTLIFTSSDEADPCNYWFIDAAATISKILGKDVKQQLKEDMNRSNIIV